MLVNMLKPMQKLENVNCTLKLPVKTRWVSVVTSLESFKKQRSAAQNCCFRRARKKKAAQCQKKSSALFWTTHFGVKAKLLKAY